MAHIAVDNIKKRTFDAIVIGSGISGGWAAKELTKHGLQTLVLERGRNVNHVTDYPTTMLMPWELEHRGQIPLKLKEEYKIASKNYIFSEETAHFLTKDKEQEYIQDKPYDWIRAYQMGGRSLIWGRQTQRWSDFDFEGPARDGFSIDWAIRYKDIAPWYDYVEKFAGISGNKDGLDVLPDGHFLPPHEMTCVEKHFKQKIADKYKNRHVIIGRAAHLTEPQQIHYDQGRAKCLNRDMCARGCPYGGYFSSNSSTLPWAAKTKKMTFRPHSVVESILYDEQKRKAVGVRIIDAITNESIEYFAKIIFVTASALGSNQILLNSRSNRFPNGLGNDNGLLGKFMAFHNYRGKISAKYDGFLDSTTDGRRPNGSYMPRFRNVLKQETDFLRGYASGLYSSRPLIDNQDGLGETLKENVLKSELGIWHISSNMMGETIPKENSTVKLDTNLTDKYGIPQLRISVGYDENDEKMLKDFFEQFTEMYQEAGFNDIKTTDTKRNPGNENHEMGGIRMGKDAKTSLLNSWNQLHTCKNVFVTDGACMTSTSTQNPSLTYMALTARAVDYAVKQLKKLQL